MNHAGIIRVPVHTAERIRKVQAARTALLQENEEEPTTAQIAQRCDLPEERVKKYLAMVPEICSLDAPARDGEEGALKLLLEDVHAPQPQEELVRRELAQTIDRLLGTLNPRQQQILRLRFGMEDGTCYSLEEIRKKLGISKERVRQIEKQAMEKLQKEGTSLGLEDFLND